MGMFPKCLYSEAEVGWGEWGSCPRIRR